VPQAFLDLIRTALDIYFYAVFAWVILSWIPMSPGHPLARIQLFLDRIISPVIRPIRRVLPPLRFGGGALDLSPIVLLLGVRIIRGLL
jgi:YggT family protein